MNQQIRPSQIVLMASGAAMFLLGSFLPFYSYDGGEFGGDADWTAWTGNPGLFPISVYPLLLGLATAVLIGLTTFANVKLPPQVLGFTWTQIYLVFAVFSGLVAIGYLLMDSGEADWGIGFWIILLGSIGLITGAIMELMEGKKAAAAGGYPGQPPYPGQPGPPPGQPPYPGQPGPPPGQPPQQF